METMETASTEVPKPDTSPAVETPPVTIGSPESILEAIKGKLHEANPATEEKPPEETEDKGIDPKSFDPKTNKRLLKELGRVQGERTRLTAQVKELEPFKGDGEQMRHVRELWNGDGDKKIEALAKLSGKDGLDELAALVQFFYEREQTDGPSGQAPPQSQESKALVAIIDDLRKELADIKANRTSDKEAADKARVDAEQKSSNDWVGRFLKAHSSEYEICARDENLSEAVDLIQSAATAIVKRDKVDTSKLEQGDAERIYSEAAKEVETEYERVGQRFAKRREQSHVFNPDKYARRLSQPTVQTKPVTLSKDPKERFEQIRQRALDKAAAGGYSR